MKKEYLEPKSVTISLPCFIWMTEGMSTMGGGESGGNIPAKPAPQKTV